MNIIFAFILEAIAFLAGVALILFAKSLSVRFGAKTTPRAAVRPVRSGQSLHPPASTLDPKALVIIFRISGTFLILGTLLPLLAIALTRHH